MLLPRSWVKIFRKAASGHFSAGKTGEDGIADTRGSVNQIEWQQLLQALSALEIGWRRLLLQCPQRMIPYEITALFQPLD
ncbi:MAG TPA: hypothetical protein VN729_12780 [Ktedonobacteraceae bacterium]|nr:hypothetical protein [Ktedonobacteraceae bacterium]